jgi:hypothetical protein
LSTVSVIGQTISFKRSIGKAVFDLLKKLAEEKAVGLPTGFTITIKHG